MNNQRRQDWVLFGLVLVLMAMMVGGVLSLPAVAQDDVTNLTGLHLEGSHSTATPVLIVDQEGLGVIAEYRDSATPVARFADGGGLEVISGGLTVTAGGATITAGGLALSDGDLDVADDLTIAKQTWITVTDNLEIAPTGSYQPIAAAGAVGTSSITAGAAGDLLILTNTGTNAITITYTGTLKLSSNAALGQYDSLFLLSDGTNWVEIGEGAN